ncbi:Protein of unknown function [Gryllus bimaculatus]|nr:Protein of unknown function [Gryllus bimaculatus]
MGGMSTRDDLNAVSVGAAALLGGNVAMRPAWAAALLLPPPPQLHAHPRKRAPAAPTRLPAGSPAPRTALAARGAGESGGGGTLRSKAEVVNRAVGNICGITC